MLTTIAVIFLILWLVGIITGNTFGWYVHILLVAAIVLLIVRLSRGRSQT